MPKDSLFILNLAAGKVEKLARVKSFAIPTEKGSWIAIHFEKELPQKDTPKDSTVTQADSTAKVEKPKKPTEPS